MAWTTLTSTNATAGNAILASDHSAAFVNLNEAPRGYVIGGKKTADQTGFTTIANVSSLSVSVPMISGRWYRITVQLDITPTVIGDVGVVTLTDTTGTALMRSVHPFAGSLDSQTAVIVYYEQASATGSVTRKAMLSRGSGTGSITASANAARPGLILVEDMGAPT